MGLYQVWICSYFARAENSVLIGHGRLRANPSPAVIRHILPSHSTMQRDFSRALRRLERRPGQGCTSSRSKFYTIAPRICGFSVWNVLHVTLLLSRILRCVLGLLSVCAPLAQAIWASRRLVECSTQISVYNLFVKQPKNKLICYAGQLESKRNGVVSSCRENLNEPSQSKLRYSSSKTFHRLWQSLLCDKLYIWYSSLARYVAVQCNRDEFCVYIFTNVLGVSHKSYRPDFITVM